MQRLPVILLLLTACATPKGEWTVIESPTQVVAAQALQIVAAAKRVLPDKAGLLAAGYTIRLSPEIQADCAICTAGTEAGLFSGCITDSVRILYPTPWAGTDLTRSALAHELAHLGLKRGGGCPPPFCEAPYWPTEAECDAAALLVLQEFRRSSP